MGGPDSGDKTVAGGEPEAGTGLVVLAEEVLLQHVADEIVFLNLDSGVYFGLEPIGSRMLELAMALDDTDAVVGQLAEEYDATPEVLGHDLEALLKDLVKNGLVTRAGASVDAVAEGPTDDPEA